MRAPDESGAEALIKAAEAIDKKNAERERLARRSAPAKGAIVVRQADWIRFGEQLFGCPPGPDWSFVCPMCATKTKAFQMAEALLAKKDDRNPAEVAARECIGRYRGGRSAFGATGPGPCDYAAFGLFNVCPVLVQLEDGRRIGVFAFEGMDFSELQRAAIEIV